jgi:hypothetical protein
MVKSSLAVDTSRWYEGDDEEHEGEGAAPLVIEVVASAESQYARPEDSELF